MPTVSLRQAEVADSGFAFDVTESAMRRYVEQTWGPWDEEWQRRSHDDSFDPVAHTVVLVDDVPSGILLIKEESSHIQLEKLYLLPRVRNRGIGSELLRMLISRSLRAEKPVHLRVLKVNLAAQRFYARHGFVIASATPERVFMEKPYSSQ